MADTNLTVRIGAALSKSFAATFGKAESGASSLGKSYAKINKELNDVRGVKRYQRELERMRREGKRADQTQEDFQRELRKTERALERAEKKVTSYGHSLTNLGRAERRLTTRKYFNEVGMRLGDRAGMFRNAGYAIGGAVTAGSVGAFYNTNRVAEQLDSAQKFSQRVGMDPRAVQELDYVAQSNGLETDRMRDALQEQSVRIGEALRGEGEALPALQALKVDPKALGGLSPDKQMEAIADALAKVPNQNVRLSLADQLYGDPGQELAPILGQGGQAIRQQREQARATGNTFSHEDTQNAAEYTQALQDAQARMSGLAGMLGTTLMPEFTALFKSFSRWFDSQSDLKGTFEQWKEDLKGFSAQVKQFGTGALAVLRPMGSAIQGIVKGLGGWENAGKLLAALMAGRLIGSVLGLGSAFRFLLGLGVAKSFTGIAKGGGMLGRVLLGLLPTLANLRAGILAMTMATSGLGGVLMGGLTKAIGVARIAVVGLGRALLLNPIGLAVTAIAGAAYLIYQNWEPIKGWFTDLWDSVTNIFSRAWQGITGVIDNVMARAKEAIANPWETIKSVFEWSPVGIVWKLWSGLFGLPGQLLDGLVERFKAAFPNLSAAISAGFAKISDKVTGWFDTIKSKFSAVGELFGFGDEDQPTGRGVRKQQSLSGNNANNALEAQLATATQQVQNNTRITNQTTAPIQVNVTPRQGEDDAAFGQRLGGMIKDALDARDRERDADQRSALYDSSL